MARVEERQRETYALDPLVANLPEFFLLDFDVDGHLYLIDITPASETVPDLVSKVMSARRRPSWRRRSGEVEVRGVLECLHDASQDRAYLVVGDSGSGASLTYQCDPEQMARLRVPATILIDFDRDGRVIGVDVVPVSAGMLPKVLEHASPMPAALPPARGRVVVGYHDS